MCRLRPQFPELRATLLNDLQALPGNHLVIVRYSPRHRPYEEWVYNHADIDGSKIVFAREMSADENRSLLEYFKDRQVWLLEPDLSPPRLRKLTNPREIA